MLSNILVHHGVIALGVVILLGTFALLLIHRSLLRIARNGRSAASAP